MLNKSAISVTERYHNIILLFTRDYIYLGVYWMILRFVFKVNQTALINDHNGIHKCHKYKVNE